MGIISQKCQPNCNKVAEGKNDTPTLCKRIVIRYLCPPVDEGRQIYYKAKITCLLWL